MMGEGEGEKAVDVVSRDEVIGCVSDYIGVSVRCVVKK